MNKLNLIWILGLFLLALPLSYATNFVFMPNQTFDTCANWYLGGGASCTGGELLIPVLGVSNWVGNSSFSVPNLSTNRVGITFLFRWKADATPDNGDKFSDFSDINSTSVGQPHGPGGASEDFSIYYDTDGNLYFGQSAYANIDNTKGCNLGAVNAGTYSIYNLTFRTNSSVDCWRDSVKKGNAFGSFTDYTNATHWRFKGNAGVASRADWIYGENASDSVTIPPPPPANITYGCLQAVQGCGFYVVNGCSWIMPIH